MNELITTPRGMAVQKLSCCHCGNAVGTLDNFCRECGTGCHDPSLEVIASGPSSRSQADVVHGDVAVVDNDVPVLQSIVNNRMAVIGVIALIGPIGLPALWLSPRFANPTKIAITVTYVLATTIVPLMIAWYWLDYSLRPLVEVFRR